MGTWNWFIERSDSKEKIWMVENEGERRGRHVASTFIDHYKSFSKALEYLYQKGHRKIGYCVGRRIGANSQQRETAYKDFLMKFNEPLEENFIFQECFNFEDGERVRSAAT